MRFKLIDRAKREFPVHRLCDVLGVSQYCSHDYRRLLRACGIVPSMSGKGNCFDNAMVETVFKTIKSELIWTTSYQTRSAATWALGRYIDGFYNPGRRHSALGYKSPVSFEATMAITQ